MSVLNICFVCGEYPPGPHGGIGTFTQVLARGLVEAGHAVRVVGVCRRDYPAPDYEQDQGVKVWRLRPARFRFGWVYDRYRLFQLISRWSRRREIDLVELPDWSGWAAGWGRLPVPVVVRLNGSTSYFQAELGEALRRTTFWLERASLRRADYWCSVSRYTAQQTRDLFGLDTGPHAILYNPVECATAASRHPRSREDVVFSGTLAYKKGVVSLIDAWRQVLACCPSARLHFYGKDGKTRDGRSMQQELSGRLNTAQRESIRFHGHVGRDRLFEALDSARLAVFPSYAEAFALAPLEAMSRGCPTIYSTRGSGREVIDDGKDGLLVDPDRPDDLGRAIIRILSDNRLAEELGKTGQARVAQDFSIGALLQKNIEFYADCVARRPRTVPAAASLSKEIVEPESQLVSGSR